MVKHIFRQSQDNRAFHNLTSWPDYVLYIYCLQELNNNSKTKQNQKPG